jgi:chaperonin cofactor prefoldin
MVKRLFCSARGGFMALEEVKTDVTKLQVEAEAFRQQIAALQKNLDDSKSRFQWYASGLLALVCAFGGLFLGAVFYAGGTIQQVSNLEKQVDRIDKRTELMKTGIDDNFKEIRITLQAIRDKQK